MASTSTGVTIEASTNSDKHQCEMCNIFFENETFLFSHYHIMHYHEKNNIYVCNKCDYTNIYLGYLRAHAREHHSYFVHYCVICDKQFYSMHEYTNHQNVHKFATSNMFVCHMCTDQLFPQFSYLVTHYKAIHSDCYICEMCKVSFKNKLSLSSHYHKHHKKKKKYVCSKCDYSSQTDISRLKHHATMYHTYYVVKYCVICDKHFSSLHEYKNHQNGHKSETSNMFKCGICKPERNYSIIGALVHHHKKRHLNKPCDMSDNTYEGKKELDEHRSVHSEQPNTYKEREKESDEYRSVYSKGPFQCKTCNEDYDDFVIRVLPIHSKLKVMPFKSVRENILYIEFLSRNPDQIPK